MPTERAVVIAKMRGAFRGEQSFNSFYTQISALGLGYRRSAMLADWREVNEVEKKEGTARYIRKGYVPTAATVELKTWELSHEYMYRVGVKAVIHPEKPTEKQFINLMSDVPLTIDQVEARAKELLLASEKYKITRDVGLEVYSVFRREKE